jgi:transposase
MPFRLTKHERGRLIRLLRQAHALLDLDEGAPPELVARRYQVARSTIYNWIKRYQTRGLSHSGFRELPRPGRPRLPGSDFQRQACA